MLTNRLEVMPSVDERKLSTLSEGTRVAVTASQNSNLSATVETCRTVSEHNLEPIAHIAARQVEDDNHLDSLLTELQEIGIEDVFVIGGDKEEPVGSFDATMDILPTIYEDYSFRVGIGGYPEKHHIIQDTDSLREQKSKYSDYISTQICFDTDAIIDWCESVEELDILVGVPGVIESSKLYSICDRIGVGSSIESISGQQSRLYTPESVYNEVQSSGRENIEGFHFNTFNYVEDTIEWIRQSEVVSESEFR